MKKYFLAGIAAGLLLLSGCAMNSGPSQKELANQYSTYSCSELLGEQKMIQSQLPVAESKYRNLKANYDREENVPAAGGNLAYMLKPSSLFETQVNEAADKVNLLRRKLYISSKVYADKCSSQL